MKNIRGPFGGPAYIHDETREIVYTIEIASASSIALQRIKKQKSEKEYLKYYEKMISENKEKELKRKGILPDGWSVLEDGWSPTGGPAYIHDETRSIKYSIHSAHNVQTKLRRIKEAQPEYYHGKMISENKENELDNLNREKKQKGILPDGWTEIHGKDIMCPDCEGMGHPDPKQVTKAAIAAAKATKSYEYPKCNRCKGKGNIHGQTVYVHDETREVHYSIRSAHLNDGVLRVIKKNNPEYYAKIISRHKQQDDEAIRKELEFLLRQAVSGRQSCAPNSRANVATD